MPSRDAGWLAREELDRAKNLPKMMANPARHAAIRPPMGALARTPHRRNRPRERHALQRRFQNLRVCSLSESLSSARSLLPALEEANKVAEGKQEPAIQAENRAFERRDFDPIPGGGVFATTILTRRFLFVFSLARQVGVRSFRRRASYGTVWIDPWPTWRSHASGCSLFRRRLQQRREPTPRAAGTMSRRSISRTWSCIT